jgi:hypothetical protein
VAAAAKETGSAAAGVAMEKAKQSAASAKEKVNEKRAEIGPKLQEAYGKAEPGLQDFLRKPQVQYLTSNPKAMIALCSLFVMVGVPGAATLSTCLSLMGPIEALAPLIVMFAEPLASILV